MRNIDAAPHGEAPRVDSHTHVFHPSLPMATDRRYTPACDASPAALFHHLDTHGLSHAVLVQPSFLGTDNSHLLKTIAGFPDRLRGIAMIDVDMSDGQLAGLQQGGVVGIRLNLVGAALPDLKSAPWTQLLRRIVAMGWHVEIHREAQDLPRVVASALDSGARVVVDHFGRPDPARGVGDAGFRALLGFAATRKVWVKVSAPYRCAHDAGAFAVEATLQLTDAFGADRLLWGSDWPHTQCESLADVSSDLAALRKALPDADARAAVLGKTAGELYGFAVHSTL